MKCNYLDQRFGLRPLGNADGKLYRSRLFRNETLEDRDWLTSFEVRRVFDLRRIQEIRKCPNISIPGIKVLGANCSDSYPVLNIDLSPQEGLTPRETIIQQYVGMAHQLSSISGIIKLVVSEDTKAVIQCTQGKDRTGVICATMLKIAGFSHQEVVEDYMQTNTVNEDEIRRDLERCELGSSRYERLLVFSQAEEEFICAYFDELEEISGSINPSLADLFGLNESEVEKMKCLLNI